MAASSSTTAAVTLVTEADATELMRLRTALNEVYAAQDIAVSYTDLLVLVVARALRDFPYMNARLAGQAIEQMAAVHIGVAVDTERGLLVPVIRDAGSKSLLELAKALRELVQRARSGKSAPDELTGGTFTITNLGMFEIDAFTPIINLPECAILGVGRLNAKPVVRDGQVCVSTMVTLSLTFDHRLTDGAPAARFLQRIKALVEQPALVSL
jgi:pyruvate/2-oxoglutarate dehydrogenase complex dihydrolipoamide acyltransferase (E2) component